MFTPEQEAANKAFRDAREAAWEASKNDATFNAIYSDENSHSLIAEAFSQGAPGNVSDGAEGSAVSLLDEVGSRVAPAAATEAAAAAGGGAAAAGSLAEAAAPLIEALPAAAAVTAGISAVMELQKSATTTGSIGDYLIGNGGQTSEAPTNAIISALNRIASIRSRM